MHKFKFIKINLTETLCMLYRSGCSTRSTLKTAPDSQHCSPLVKAQKISLSCPQKQYCSVGSTIILKKLELHGNYLTCAGVSKEKKPWLKGDPLIHSTNCSVHSKYFASFYFVIIDIHHLFILFFCLSINSAFRNDKKLKFLANLVNALAVCYTCGLFDLWSE